MLPGESRNGTSQERVGCGLKVSPPAGIVHEARESAGNDRVFLVGENRVLGKPGKKPGFHAVVKTRVQFPGLNPGKTRVWPKPRAKPGSKGAGL